MAGCSTNYNNVCFLFFMSIIIVIQSVISSTIVSSINTKMLCYSSADSGQDPISKGVNFHGIGGPRGEIPRNRRSKG